MEELYNKRQNLFLLLFLVFIFILFIHPLSLEGDLYHHLNTGKFILTNHQLPHKDEWTFTASGKEWVAYAWGSSIVLYLIYSAFGVGGLIFLVAAVAVLTIYLTYLLLLSYGLQKKLTFLLVTSAACLFLIRFPSRPEIFSYPLILSILLIDKLSLKRPRLVLIYPLIIYIWSIFYGSSVVAGLILLIILSIFRHKKEYFLSFAMAIFISLFNGYGLKSIFYIFYIPQVAQIQGEWLGIREILRLAPPSYLSFFYFSLAIYLFYLLFYLFVLTVSVKRIRKNFLEFLLSLGIFAPIFAFRQVPISVILSLPFLSTTLEKLDNRKAQFLLLGLAAFSLITTLIYSPPQLDLKEDPSKIGVLNFIEKNKLFGKIYTSQQIGSFLSFKLYPKALVSYDTRDDLFFGTQYLKESLSPIPFRLILNKYHPDLVVLDLNEDQSKAKDLPKTTNQWESCYFNESYLVFCRSSTAF